MANLLLLDYVFSYYKISELLCRVFPFEEWNDGTLKYPPCGLCCVSPWTNGPWRIYLGGDPDKQFCCHLRIPGRTFLLRLSQQSGVSWKGLITLVLLGFQGLVSFCPSSLLLFLSFFSAECVHVIGDLQPQEKLPAPGARFTSLYNFSSNLELKEWYEAMIKSFLIFLKEGLEKKPVVVCVLFSVNQRCCWGVFFNCVLEHQARSLLPLGMGI